MRNLFKDTYFVEIFQRTIIYEIYILQNTRGLNSVVLPIGIDVESFLFLYLTRTFNTSVYLTFQISNLLCEKNKNTSDILTE